MTKRAIVLGASGTIGVHLVDRLVREKYTVHAFDRRDPLFGWLSPPSKFEKLDLSNPVAHYRADFDADLVFQLAAEMGGAGYVFSGENDLDIMTNSARININVANRRSKGRIFFSSSACVYPEFPWGENNEDAWASLEEHMAYPAEPDSNYGFEKLFSERLYATSGKDVRIARLHNVFATHAVFEGGREKAPAAIARKVAEAEFGGEIEVWGDGHQKRSFLYVDECVEGILRLVDSDFRGPVNIGSTYMLSINDLVDAVCMIAGKQLTKKYVAGPTGVRGRNSNNELIRQKLGWAPSKRLHDGLALLYYWVAEQVKNRPAEQPAVDKPVEPV